jgi:ureidoglycolate hydrolase
VKTVFYPMLQRSFVVIVVNHQKISQATTLKVKARGRVKVKT